MEATTAFGTLDGVVGEITRLHRSQMGRPTLEDVEAAEALAHAANREERARLNVAEALRRSPLVPEELVYVAQEMHRTLAGFQCLEQRDATRILELDALHALFDELIQRASQCVPSTSTGAEPRITSTAAAGAASSSFLISLGVACYGPLPNVFSAERTMGRSTGSVSMNDY